MRLFKLSPNDGGHAIIYTYIGKRQLFSLRNTEVIWVLQWAVYIALEWATMRRLLTS